MSTSNAAANRAMYIGLGIGATMITGALSYIFYRYLKRDVMPLKWRRVGTLEQIFLYPIKSCGRLEFPQEDEISCEVLGLRLHGVRDRALMLVNENNEMVTARGYPKMVLISCKLLGETKLLITAEGMEALELDFATLADEAPGKDVQTSVWGAKLDVMLCGAKFDKWFSRCILKKDSGIKLVYYAYPKPMRAIGKNMAKEPFMRQEDSGTFGDETSYMLTNLASVEDLNTRTPRPVDALQFRGNFHLKMDTNEAYAEDHWQWIRIGEDAVFRKVAPCTRCIVPNVNAHTGERDPNMDPLKTLKGYRLFKNYTSPAFGIHMGLRRAGSIKANDVIYVEDV